MNQATCARVLLSLSRLLGFRLPANSHNFANQRSLVYGKHLEIGLVCVALQNSDHRGRLDRSLRGPVSLRRLLLDLDMQTPCQVGQHQEQTFRVKNANLLPSIQHHASKSSLHLGLLPTMRTHSRRRPARRAHWLHKHCLNGRELCIDERVDRRPLLCAYIQVCQTPGHQIACQHCL